MDLTPDIWGQLAVEASQVYLSDGTIVNPFANTVRYCNSHLHHGLIDVVLYYFKTFWSFV